MHGSARDKLSSIKSMSQMRQRLGVEHLMQLIFASHGERFAMLRIILPVLFALSLSTEAAMAANCDAYPLPYSLTNGQTADANQVMGNFNDVVNCVNALSAVTGPASSVTGHLATFA